MFIAFALYMLLCIPALAAQTVGGYVSNTPMAAGRDASIGEVWMRHGGARLQYDALMGSVQTNTNGRIRRDPASITSLPPLKPQKRAVRKVNKAPKAVSKKAPTPMPGKVNPSPKPKLNKKSISGASGAPYTGQAPIAPSAKENDASNTNKTDITPNPSIATPANLTPATSAATPPTINPVPNTGATSSVTGNVTGNTSTSTTQQ